MSTTFGISHIEERRLGTRKAARDRIAWPLLILSWLTQRVLLYKNSLQAPIMQRIDARIDALSSPRETNKHSWLSKTRKSLC